MQDKIDNAYKTLNHQISRRLIDFAIEQNAGTIQVEDLGSIKEVLTGTFLGQRWRYSDLQQFIDYKAKEVGIKVVKVDPKYTSRRCSKCGHIHIEFTRKFRDKYYKKHKKTCPFDCPNCDFEDHPDYNAAKNLTIKGIDKLIEKQCKKQDIEISKKPKEKKKAI